jgi:hypothetical protein
MTLSIDSAMIPSVPGIMGIHSVALDAPLLQDRVKRHHFHAPRAGLGAQCGRILLKSAVSGVGAEYKRKFAEVPVRHDAERP